MRRGSEIGFTLLELLIAITILMFSMLAVVPLMVSSVSVDTSTSIKSRAQMFGMERLNQLQFISENNIAGCQGVLCPDGTETFKGITLSRSYRFDPVSTGGAMRPSYIITMVVSYTLKGETNELIFTAPWIRR